MSVAVNVWSVGDGGKEAILKSELQKMFSDSPGGHNGASYWDSKFSRAIGI
jgi:hypothetical protein